MSNFENPPRFGKTYATRMMHEVREQAGSEACGFAFDLGREEATRARQNALVEADRWLEEGRQLAGVSDAALKTEIERRRWARIIQQEDAETAASLARYLNAPPTVAGRLELAAQAAQFVDIRDVLPPGDSVTVNGVVFTGNPRSPPVIVDDLDGPVDYRPPGYYGGRSRR